MYGDNKKYSPFQNIGATMCSSMMEYRLPYFNVTELEKTLYWW